MRNEPGIRGRHGCVVPTQEENVSELPEVIYVAGDQNGEDRYVFETDASLSVSSVLRKRYTVRYVRADTAPQLSEEQRDLLELFELLRRVGREKHVAVDWKMYSDGSENISIDGHLFCFDSLDVAIDIVRARLRPEKPTEHEGRELLRKVHDYGRAHIDLGRRMDPDALDMLQEIEDYFQRHEAAEKWSTEEVRPEKPTVEGLIELIRKRIDDTYVLDWNTDYDAEMARALKEWDAYQKWSAEHGS